MHGANKKLVALKLYEIHFIFAVNFFIYFSNIKSKVIEIKSILYVNKN